MSLKAKVEAIIYAAEEPITLEQISLLLKDIVLADLASAKENAEIEKADNAAEAEANATAVATGHESEILPEIMSESADLISPEPGPLMQNSDEESSEENSASSAADAGAGEEDQTEKASADPSAQGTLGLHDSSPETPNVEVTPAPQELEPPAASEPAESASVSTPETTARKRQPKKTEQEIAEDKAVRARIREVVIELVTDYASEDRGIEIRQVAGGFRMATKPEHHDVVRAFAKSLKPPIRLSLAALETLAVIAYKQPITAPEISDIRGVESASVLGTLLDRKLITTAGRKQVIGRPMQYKTSKDFLLRFGLNSVNELPSMEEFSQLASDGTIEITPSEPHESQSLFEPDAKDAGAVAEAVVEAEALVPNRSSEQITEAEEHPALESVDAVQLDRESEIPEAHDQPIPEPQQDTARAADSQPQSEAESSNVPEAEHPIGR
jgi:segregation and condensation protein B